MGVVSRMTVDSSRSRSRLRSRSSMLEAALGAISLSFNALFAGLFIMVKGWSLYSSSEVCESWGWRIRAQQWEQRLTHTKYLMGPSWRIGRRGDPIEREHAASSLVHEEATSKLKEENNVVDKETKVFESTEVDTADSQLANTSTEECPVVESSPEQQKRIIMTWHPLPRRRYGELLAELLVLLGAAAYHAIAVSHMQTGSTLQILGLQ
ncbi:hypothetical protein L7F22_064044 [Adiantum nelumboides]|nr:hypothetical protein [Adiantum nelumboides]